VLDQLRGATVDFVPYWDWPFTDTLIKRDIYASLYRQPARSVLAVANLSPDGVRLEIPRQELTRLRPSLRTARDDMDRRRVELDERALRMHVPAKDFRLVTLE
jgi:hypothetical protein